MADNAPWSKRGRERRSKYWQCHVFNCRVFSHSDDVADMSAVTGSCPTCHRSGGDEGGGLVVVGEGLRDHPGGYLKDELRPVPSDVTGTTV
jgi:hypothetical protein